tara:strand:+ start:533 stop:1051 length:519 start_codon:yes stop_codon:yes gene_type:complete
MCKFRSVALVLSCAAVLFTADAAHAATVTVAMHKATVDGPGKDLGTIAFEDTPQGMVITPRLMGLQEGLHGFHVDEFPSCAAKKKNGVTVPALAAGNPLGTDKSGKDHPGDLPGLYVHYDGAAYNPTIAPNIKTADLVGHAIVVDALGPAYRDAPKPVGGAVQRVACGVVLR